MNYLYAHYSYNYCHVSHRSLIMNMAKTDINTLKDHLLVIVMMNTLGYIYAYDSNNPWNSTSIT